MGEVWEILPRALPPRPPGLGVEGDCADACRKDKSCVGYQNIFGKYEFCYIFSDTPPSHDGWQTKGYNWGFPFFKKTKSCLTNSELRKQFWQFDIEHGKPSPKVLATRFHGDISHRCANEIRLTLGAFVRTKSMGG